MTIRLQLPQVMMNLNHRERERVSRKTFLLTVVRKNTHHACADVVIIAITWHLTHAWRWSKHCIEGTSRCIIIVPSFPQFLQSRLIFFICTRVTTLHPCYMKNALVFSQSDARYFFMYINFVFLTTLIQWWCCKEKFDAFLWPIRRALFLHVY